MKHVFVGVDNSTSDTCLTCGATRSDIENDIATLDCLGRAGFLLRKQALTEQEQGTSDKNAQGTLASSYSYITAFHSVPRDIVALLSDERLNQRLAQLFVKKLNRLL